MTRGSFCLVTRINAALATDDERAVTRQKAT